MDILTALTVNFGFRFVFFTAVMIYAIAPFFFPRKLDAGDSPS